MGKIIHPLGKKGGTLTPFVDGTASNEANINFYVVGNMEVYAMVDGTIVDIDEKDKLGNTITIKTNSFNYNNNENLYLTYCRLGEVLVNKGDKINAGSVIAKTIGTNYKTSNIITIFCFSKKTSESKAYEHTCRAVSCIIGISLRNKSKARIQSEEQAAVKLILRTCDITKVDIRIKALRCRD